MFIYALVLAGIRREFPRYTKLNHKLELRRTYFVKKIRAMSLVFDFSCEVLFSFGK